MIYRSGGGVWPRVVRVLFVLSLVAATLATTGASAHPEQGRTWVENFSARDYRGNPTLFSPAQAADGVMHFVSFGSLITYDGRNWDNIPVSDRPMLRATPAADGSVYVSPMDDIGRVARDADGRWRYTSLAAALPDEIKPLSQVWTIQPEGRDLIFSTLTRIVRLPDGDPARAQSWTPADASTALNMPAHSAATVVPVLVRLDGKLHWFQRGTGLQKFANGRFVPVWPGLAALRDPQLSAILGTPDGGLRIVKFDGTVHQVDPDGRETVWSNQVSALLGNTPIRGVALMPDGGVLLASGGRGVFILAPGGALRRHLTEELGLETGLLISAFRDREHGYWVTHMRGATRIEFEPQVTVFDQRNGLGRTGLENVVRHGGRLYGYGQDGLFQLEPAAPGTGASARWRQIDVGQERVRQFMPTDDELWFGTISSFGRLTAEGYRSFGALPGQSIAHLFLSPDRVLVSFDNGIRLFEREGAEWKHRFDLPGVSGPVLSLVAAGAPGEVWAGTLTRGLLRYTIPADAAEPAAVRVRSYGAEDGLTTKTQNVMVRPAGGGRLLFVAPDAAFFHDEGTDRFTPAGEILRVNDRPVVRIDAISSAADGRLFLQAGLGGENTETVLGWFRPNPEGRPVWQPLPARYRQRLGPNGAVALYHDSTGADDTLWVLGPDATLRLDLNEPVLDTPPPAAVIRRAERGANTLLPDAPPLPHSTQALRFMFAAPSFLDQATLRFQTRLIGYEERWSDPDTRREVEFTNLGGGSYAFEVRAIDGDGRVGPVAAFAFTLAPPWHLSWWALAAYAVLAAAGLWTFVRWRLATAERERRRLETIVAARTAELRAEKERADQASRAKSTFLAHMSHELRTPLNGIIGYAQVLLKDAAVAGAQRERVNIVHASGLHLLRMINEVLDFSKIEAGKIERRDETFHLGQLLRELAVAHEAAAQGRGLAFALELPDGEPDHVSGDAQKLRQILDNLLSNAVKFTKQGRVTLRVERAAAENCRAGSPNPASGEFWRFTITDTGVGMDTDDLARLFQPFEQARKGRPTEPGTGLGLAITQRLVRLLGGDLQVESSPGRGTTFSFALALPAVDAPRPASRSPFPVTGYAGPRRRIAVVDDHAINRSLLRDLLEPLGFEIVEFDSAEALLAVAPEALGADLAFLDVKLPGIDGLDLARRLRERSDTRTLPLVFTSASVLTFDHATAAALGCPDFLPKPFAEAQLNELLTRLLDLRWERAGAPAAPASSAAPLPRALIDELLALAESGDIAALRGAVSAALQAHPGHVTLKQVETAAASYQLEAVRQLLRTAPTA